MRSCREWAGNGCGLLHKGCQFISCFRAYLQHFLFRLRDQLGVGERSHIGFAQNLHAVSGHFGRDPMIVADGCGQRNDGSDLAGLLACHKIEQKRNIWKVGLFLKADLRENGDLLVA